LGEVEACLAELMQGAEPLVKILPARPGQKEQRYAQLLSVETPESDSSVPLASAYVADSTPAPSRLEALEAEVATLRLELQALRDELAAFRKQFE
jgi:uncharacterized protein YceH (UPF0502 family)